LSEPPIAWPYQDAAGRWQLPAEERYREVIDAIRLGGLLNASSLTNAVLDPEQQNRLDDAVRR
jgi:hypothetical protein